MNELIENLRIGPFASDRQGQEVLTLCDKFESQQQHIEELERAINKLRESTVMVGAPMEWELNYGDLFGKYTGPRPHED
jgi:hypothetical protein